MNQVQFFLSDELATVNMGKSLAQVTKALDVPSLVVFLNGDLGAGKTTLTRGFVQGMGHTGNVKSPTYTIVEPYDLDPWQVFHFDLYRLSDPEELEYMGIRDYFNDKCCCFIEWPEKGTGILAKEDLIVDMKYDNEQRRITLTAVSDVGKNIIKNLTVE